MYVRTMLSNHHVHLDKEKLSVLFGEEGITSARDIGGEFVSKEWVEVIGPKGSFKCHVIFGGPRDRTQVEVLRSDNYILGIDAPVRPSGSKDGLAHVTVRGPKGEFEGEYAMVAWRHIHVGGKNLEGTPFEGKTFCKLRAGGDRGLTFDKVLLLSYPGIELEPFCHLDTEEGNAAKIANGDMLEMLPE